MRLLQWLTLLTYVFWGSVIVEAIRVPRDGTQTTTTALETGRQEQTTSATDDSASSTITSTTGSGSHSTATNTGSPSNTTSVPTSTTSAPASQNTSTPGSKPSILPSNITDQPTKIREDGTHATAPDGLLLQPKITPGLAVAGAILITVGGIYASLGMWKLWYYRFEIIHSFTVVMSALFGLTKIPRIQAFLSAAFLTSLSVTVLIIYLMSPPVSTAMQGAYIVAIVLPGIVLGGISVFFREWTEGLGCLLGGFCLSMWILTLKKGGLLTKTGPKVGFIVALCAGIYALSFTKYTRPYALLPSASFSGATALMLGVDCFTRVGLKEFWLYIWALNDEVFPAKTQKKPYPTTRGIRAETGAIVGVCFLGLLFQVKFWEFLQEGLRKEKDQKNDEEKVDEEAEVEAGKRISHVTSKELGKWEARYDGAFPKSAVNSVPTGDTASGAGGDISGDAREKGSAPATEREHSSSSKDKTPGVDGAEGSVYSSTRGYKSDISSINGSELAMLRALGIPRKVSSKGDNILTDSAEGSTTGDRRSSVAGTKGEDVWSIMRDDHRDEEPSDVQKNPTAPETTESGTPTTVLEPKGKARMDEEAKASSSSSSSAKEQNSGPLELREEILRDISQQISKVGSSYRTYEWAKHAPAGEPFETNPIQPLKIWPEDKAHDNEAPAPVDVDELLQTPLTAVPPPAVRRETSHGTDASKPKRRRRRSRARQNLRHSRNKSWDPTDHHRTHDTYRPYYMHSKSTPNIRIQDTVYSRPRIPPPRKEARDAERKPAIQNPRSLLNVRGNVTQNKHSSVSLPYVARIPQKNGSTPPKRRQGETADAGKSTTQNSYSLLNVREDMVRNKLSSVSLPHDPWLSRTKTGPQGQSPGPGPPTMQGATDNNDDSLPLSQRRALMRQQHQTAIHQNPSGKLYSQANSSQSRSNAVLNPSFIQSQSHVHRLQNSGSGSASDIASIPGGGGIHRNGTPAQGRDTMGQTQGNNADENGGVRG